MDHHRSRLEAESHENSSMALDLKNDPETIELYKEYHRAVWPEVLDGLRSLGISKMKIFLHGRRLFIYVEVPNSFDLRRDFPRYMRSGRAREWDELMRTYQEQVPGARADEWWVEMEEVFDLKEGWPPIT